jgi:GNAT superfamily N-acetyltransferase
MIDVEIHPVVSARERRTFLAFPWQIYRGDPLWVPPLLPERAKTIDPRQGAFFLRGQAEFFIAWRSGRPVGTICAAEDRVTNAQRGKRDCMYGFFECIEDQAVAFAMFDHAASWGRARGLDSLYGPWNLDYEDSYGVLLEGRDRPPVLLCGHTPSYYLDMHEAYGFLPARGDNLAYEIQLGHDAPALQLIAKLAERLRRRGTITIRHADLAHWEDEVDRLVPLMNAALAHLPDFIPWQPEALRATLGAFREIADPELILFAEVKGRVVGWFPAVPNINEALIHANGLRRPWDYIHLAWLMRRRPKCAAIKSVVVYPEYWDTGVSVLLFDEMARRLHAKGYLWADLSLTSDDNPYTPHLIGRAGGTVYKRYRVYRKPIVP